MRKTMHDIIMRMTTFIVVSTVLIISLGFFAYFLFVQYNYFGDHQLSVAKTLSQNPYIIECMAADSFDDEFYKYIDMLEDGESFYITISDENGVRKAHLYDELIGTQVQTNATVPMTREDDYYEFDSAGAVGAGFKAFSVVLTEDGEFIGNVIVSQTRNNFMLLSLVYLTIIIVLAVIAVMISLFLSDRVSKSIRKILLNYEPEDIVRITKEREVALNTINEGVLLYNKQEELSFANDAAKKMLRIDTDDVGSHAMVYDKFNSVKEKQQTHSTVQYNKKEYYVEKNEVKQDGEVLGSVFTIRPREAVFVFAEELTGVQNYMEAVRAQVHEFRNTIHTIAGLIDMERYDKLKHYIQSVVKKHNRETLELDNMISGHILRAFLHSKYARAREMGVSFTVVCKNLIPEITEPEQLNDIITIIGNLLENAFECFDGESDNPIVSMELSFDEYSKYLGITVRDNAGKLPKNDIFEKGFSTKGEGRGLGLWRIKNCVKEQNGTIRHYGDEEKTEFNIRLKLKIGDGNEHQSNDCG